MVAEDCSEEALRLRLRELVVATPDIGYRAVHAALQAEASFSGVGLKRVQKLLREVRVDPETGHTSSSVVQESISPQSAATGRTDETASASSEMPGGHEDVVDGTFEITLTRPDLSHKFGMMIDTQKCADGGHAVTDVRQGGVVDQWNTNQEAKSIAGGDIILSVNGKTSFEDMMEEFKQSLECALKVSKRSGSARGSVLREDTSEATKEKAKWEQRKAHVTAALIPGLKKLVDQQFGAGACDRICRVEDMYQRVGRSEVHEEDGPLGQRYAPGYIEGLFPVQPFHDTRDYPWCAELRSHWKAIRKELRGCLDERLWTPGAYQASNEAYGKDWKIMGVLIEGKFQDEQRFKVTTGVIKQLPGVHPSEAFFARMPAHTKIAPHSDNLSYILTSHLALDLEEGLCSIKAGNEERQWKEGEMMVIDTSFIHSTKNESARPRYILVFRFWHPGLTDEERHALHLSHVILAGTGKAK